MRTRYTARVAALLLVLVTALVCAACGSDDSSSDSSSKSDSTKTTKSTTDTASTSDSGDAQVLELKNDGNNLAFDKKTLTATAGKVTIKLTNDSSIPHNVALEDKDGNEVGDAGELVTGGDTSEVTADLKPGTYTYYCEPHKSSGMTGTLTVS